MTTELETCPVCNGSGEGMHEGSRCHSCKGTGVERVEYDEDDYEPENEDE